MSKYPDGGITKLGVSGQKFTNRLKSFLCTLNYFDSKKNVSKNLVKTVFDRIFDWEMNIDKLSRIFSLPVSRVEHHMAHAASSYLMSDFDTALCITIDGQGDEITASVNYCNKHKIERICEFTRTENGSLGFFYAAITRYLGYIPFQDEAQISRMSLSGTHNNKLEELFNKVISVDKNAIFRVNHDFILDCDFYQDVDKYPQLCSRELARMLDDYNPIDVAFMAQHLLEKVIINLVIEWVNKTKINNVCLAGGVFLNRPLLNKLKQKEFLNIYCPPWSGDEGLSIGSALSVEYSLI